MRRITNDMELRDAYEWLNIWETVPVRPDNAATVKAKTDALKRQIRAYNNTQSDRRIVRSAYDGAVVLINIPEGIDTREDAEDWFDAEERIIYTDRGYDCTGQPFTSWHYIGKLGGKMVCWHCISIDV